MISLDERLFFLINGLAGRSPAFDQVMALLVGDYLIPVTASVVVFALWFSGKGAHGRERNQRAIFTTATAVGFACAIVKLMNLGIERLRPLDRKSVV